MRPSELFLSSAMSSSQRASSRRGGTTGNPARAISRRSLALSAEASRPALLELDDRYAVIKAQLPTALVLLIVNIGLMYVFAFR